MRSHLCLQVKPNGLFPHRRPSHIPQQATARLRYRAFCYNCPGGEPWRTHKPLRTARKQVLNAAAAISRLGNDPAFYRRLLQQFAANADHELGRAEAAWQRSDCRGLVHALDSLRGASLCVGAETLVFHTSAAISMATRQGLSARNPVTHALRRSVGAVKRAAQRWEEPSSTKNLTKNLQPHESEAHISSRALELLVRLRSKLDCLDFRAIGLFDEIQASGLPECPASQHLSAAMERLDFDTAIRALNALLEQA